MKKRLCLLFYLFLIWNMVYSQQIPVFRNGDRIVFVGNSITCSGYYHSYIWLYYMTRFPNSYIEIINEGISGETARLMSMRMDRIFQYNPTVVTLSFGMNDTGYEDFTIPEKRIIGEGNVEAAFEAYGLIEREFNKNHNVRKILIGSSPYDETSRFNDYYFRGKNKFIQEISDFLYERAKINRWGYVDFNRPMVDINIFRQKIDSTYTLCGIDRVHPAMDGHMVMAYLFLRAQGMVGKPVADIGIDAIKKTVVRSENCRISSLDVSSDSIGFMYLANSLPYPLNNSEKNGKHSQADALDVVPFMDEMNWEGLSVHGLSDGYWILKIDDMVIARLNARELNRGINLASYENTPQFMQAMKIRQMNDERWRIEHEMREYYWMEYYLMRDRGLLWKGNEAAVDTLRAHCKTDKYVNGSKDFWLRYKNPGMRIDGEKEQKDIIQRIYMENKPHLLHVSLIKDNTLH